MTGVQTCALPILRPKNLTYQGLDLSEIAHLTLKRNPVTVSQNDVLVGLTGASSGLAVIASAEAEGMVINNNIARVRIHAPDCAPQYLVAYLNSHLGVEIIGQHIISATTQSLPISGLAEVEVAIPPASEQNSIIKRVFEQDLQNVRVEREQQLQKLVSEFWSRTSGIR